MKSVKSGHTALKNLPELILSASRGDYDAFTEVFLLHRIRIRSSLILRGCRPHDADDILQDTFIRAYKQIRSRGLDDPSEKTFGRWLTRIAHNRLTDYRRRYAVEARAMCRQHGEEAMEDRPPWDREIPQWFLDGLSAMSECSQQAIQLRYIDGMPLADVSAELGVSIDTARRRIYRGFKSLRASYRRWGKSNA